MENMRVMRQNGMPLDFAGTMEAFATTRNGNKSRWTEITVWRTAGGKYVLLVSGMTLVDGERERHHGSVHDSKDDVKAAMRPTRIAADVLTQLGVEAVLHIN